MDLSKIKTHTRDLHKILFEYPALAVVWHMRYVDNFSAEKDEM